MLFTSAIFLGATGYGFWNFRDKLAHKWNMPEISLFPGIHAKLSPAGVGVLLLAVSLIILTVAAYLLIKPFFSNAWSVGKNSRPNCANPPTTPPTR